MKTDRARSRSQGGFFAAWVLLSTSGAVIGLFLAGAWYAFSLLSDLAVPVESVLVPFCLLLAICGGSLQSLVINWNEPAAPRWILWILASVLGSLVSMGAISLLNTGILRGWGNTGQLVDAAVFGAFIGLCQGLTFRHPRWAAPWVVASAVGCAVGAGSTAIAVGSLTLLWIAPLPYSIITGLALIAFIRSSSPKVLARTSRHQEKSSTP